MGGSAGVCLCVEQHVSPGRGKGLGTLTSCSAPSEVGLWSTELEHAFTEC